MAVDTALLEDVKNYLDITWSDDAADKKITGFIARGMMYLDSVAGTALTYLEEDKPKELLMEYCRYARSNALGEFQSNYLHELLTLQFKQEVATYEAENPNTDV